MKTMQQVCRLLCAVGMLRSPALAQPPELLNAQLETAAVAADLSSTLETLVGQSGGPVWVAWSVPMIDGERSLCCGHWNERGSFKEACRLESSNRRWSFTTTPPPLARVGSQELAILMRLDKGELGDLRAFSWSCPIDAGGRRVIWLDTVEPGDSVDLLHRVAAGSPPLPVSKSNVDEALMALALHATPATDAALENLAGQDSPQSAREAAIFWLGEARGRRGYRALDRLLASEPDPDIRSRIAFALSESQEPEASERLMMVGRQDPDAEVRGEALFWLGQEGGQGAVDTLMAAIESDREVRGEAIFALSQLPENEGTPLLLEIVRDRSQPASVRQEALFWLAQSEDDRAVDLIAEILRR